MGMFTTLLHSLLDRLCGGGETEPQSPLQRPTQYYQYQQGSLVTRPLPQKPLPPLPQAPPLPWRPYKAPQLQYYPSQQDHLVTRPAPQKPYGAPQLQHQYQQGRPVTRPVFQKPYESPQIQQSYQQGRPATRPASQKPYEAPQLQHPYQQGRPVTRPVSHKPYEAPQPQHTYPPVQQKPESKPQPARRASPGPQKSLNHENQQDSHYQDIRARANEEASKMRLCFEDSRTVHANGDRARAKELSNEGKEHKAEMGRLNAQARKWIFAKNNKDRAPGEVDLHGLNVKEAITYSERAINDARCRGDTKIRLIVGKGLHSQGGIPKLKPAIENFMRKKGLVAELDPNNSGVLIVHLDGRSTRAGLMLGVDDISRSLEDSERFGRPRL